MINAPFGLWLLLVLDATPWQPPATLVEKNKPRVISRG